MTADEEKTVALWMAPSWLFPTVLLVIIIGVVLFLVAVRRRRRSR